MHTGNDSDVTCAFISNRIKDMSRHKILKARERVCSELDTSIPVVERVLDIIDGQLVLRDIGGGEWR